MTGDLQEIRGSRASGVRGGDLSRIMEGCCWQKGNLKLLRGVVRKTTEELLTDSHNCSNP